jgi:hypothetical protein
MGLITCNFDLLVNDIQSYPKMIDKNSWVVMVDCDLTGTDSEVAIDLKLAEASIIEDMNKNYDKIRGNNQKTFYPIVYLKKGFNLTIEARNYSLANTYRIPITLSIIDEDQILQFFDVLKLIRVIKKMGLNK